MFFIRLLFYTYKLNSLYNYVNFIHKKTKESKEKFTQRITELESNEKFLICLQFCTQH